MTRVKAKRNCKFGYEGTMYVFKEEEEREINVPAEAIDTNSFEILGGREEKKPNKKKDKERGEE